MNDNHSDFISTPPEIAVNQEPLTDGLTTAETIALVSSDHQQETTSEPTGTTKSTKTSDTGFAKGNYATVRRLILKKV